MSLTLVDFLEGRVPCLKCEWTRRRSGHSCWVCNQAGRMVNGRATEPDSTSWTEIFDGLLNLRLARRTSRSDNGDRHKEGHFGWQSWREGWLNQLGGEVRFGIGWQWRGVWWPEGGRAFGKIAHRACCRWERRSGNLTEWCRERSV